MSFDSDKALAWPVRDEMTTVLQKAADELHNVEPELVLLAVVMGRVEDGYLVGALAHPAEGWKAETLADVLTRLGTEIGQSTKVN